MPYRAPVSEFRFLLDHVVGFDRVAGTERYGEATPDLVEAILTGAGTLCDEVLAPLQRVGDRDPARLDAGQVRTPAGFGDAHRAVAEGGWIGMSADPAHGGMGLPVTLTTAVNDMMSGACLAFQLSPLMSQGQIEALEAHGSEALRERVLPRLISGEWTGTMNLTEPQAGSDVGALTTRAEPAEDGTYRVTGQKIYITWGDTDFAGNVCHLVLARLPDGPPGTRGISLFLVPKLLEDGTANAVRVVSLEEKLGLHGSPTAVMAYEGATGWLVGEAHGGMAAMFTMMNNARLGVGTQGIGVAEAALQMAAAHAEEREQGGGPIAGHPDVARMLAVMRAEVFAARAIALSCAVAGDMARATGEADWAARAALLVPVAKAFGTDTGLAVASLGVQVHGGMGYIEETGAAQLMRDVRVTSIYEGTNGIQAMDLVGRKLRDGGEAVQRLMDEICADAVAARGDHPALADAVYEAAESLREATETLVAAEPAARNAVAVPYLSALARVLGGQAHLAAAVHGGARRQRLAEVYIRMLLPEHAALLAAVTGGAESVLALEPGDFRP